MSSIFSSSHTISTPGRAAIALIPSAGTVAAIALMEGSSSTSSASGKSISCPGSSTIMIGIFSPGRPLISASRSPSIFDSRSCISGRSLASPGRELPSANIAAPLPARRRSTISTVIPSPIPFFIFVSFLLSDLVSDLSPSSILSQVLTPNFSIQPVSF
ncbi:MAG: hypothetical protein DDT32_02186 [Syntrophomonadaceae bacterium]|nr:hypothetical protein [Bacillota bacterium]